MQGTLIQMFYLGNPNTTLNYPFPCLMAAKYDFLCTLSLCCHTSVDR